MEQADKPVTEGSAGLHSQKTSPNAPALKPEMHNSNTSLSKASIEKGPPSMFHRPLPTVMKIYYQWNLSGLKYYYVCGENERDRIFEVEAHTGHSLSGPLGIQPGIYLYDGPSHKDAPMLAAFGQDSVARGWSFTRRCVILFRTSSPSWKTEIMRARTTPKPDNNVHFGFGVDVKADVNGEGRMRRRRETFEWRKVKKSERDDGTPKGGFQLLWLSANNAKSDNANADANTDAGAGADTDTDLTRAPVVALLSWHSFFASPKHPFDLVFTGNDERFAKLGEKCSLMVLMTALGLHWLHANGKTHRGPVAALEKINGPATEKGKGQEK